MKEDQVAQVLNILIRGKIDLPSYAKTLFNPIGDGLIQVQSEDDDLWLIYYRTDPNPLRLSGPFVNALRYFIASDLSPLYKESSGLRAGRHYYNLALNQIDEAQSLDIRSSSDNPKPTTIDDTLYKGQPDGSTIYKEPVAYNY